MKSLVVAASLGLGVAACATTPPPRWNVDKTASWDRARSRLDVRRCQSGEGEWCFAAGVSLYANRPIEAVTFDGVPATELLLEAPELESSYTVHKAFAGELFEFGCEKGNLPSCLMAAKCMQELDVEGKGLFTGTRSSRAQESSLLAEKACKGDYLAGCQLLEGAASITGDKEKLQWARERIVALGGGQSGG